MLLLIHLFVTETTNFTLHPEQFINRVAGEEVTLSCAASGYPTPSLKWVFKDNQKIKEVDETELLSIYYISVGNTMKSSVTIHGINLLHVGMYACLADNETYSNTSIIEIECKSI